MQRCSAYDDLYEQTVMTKEMNKRLGDVMCIAPWTELNLKSKFEIGEQERQRELRWKCYFGLNRKICRG